MPARPRGTSKPTTVTGSTTKPRNTTTGSTSSSPRTQQKRPGDFTGVRKQQLDKEHSDVLARQEAESALATAAATARDLDEVVDYSGGKATEDTTDDIAPLELTDFETVPEALDEDSLWAHADSPLPEPESAVASATEVKRRFVTIRVNSPIEDMVFGREVEYEGDRENGVEPIIGNLRFFTFEEGKRYTVPIDLALHLEEKGYIYH